MVHASSTWSGMWASWLNGIALHYDIHAAVTPLLERMFDKPLAQTKHVQTA